jgi:hypothetical protein
MMFYQKNFLMVAELTFVTGFTSTHFVKYSMTIIAKLYFPCAGVNLPTMLMPHRWRGQDRAINCTGCAGAFDRRENFWQVSHAETSFAVSSITAGQ